MAHIKSLILILIMLLSFQALAFAFPTPPSQYHGIVKINDQYALPGTNVTVKDKNKVDCGYFSVQKYGEYIISCRADNPSTNKNEGAEEFEAVTIYINGIKVAESIFRKGSFTRLDLNLKIINHTDIERAPQSDLPASLPILIAVFTMALLFVIMKLTKIDNEE